MVDVLFSFVCVLISIRCLGCSFKEIFRTLKDFLLLCNDCCNFAPNSFYEVNSFKFCNPYLWLTSYLSFGARYQKSLHNKNSKYLEEHFCQVTRF